METPLWTETEAQSLAGAVVAAGRAVAALAGAGLEPTTKADGTPVTAADIAAERILLERIRADFPDLAIISEESSPAMAVPGREAPFLLIDPIDGTRELLAGRDCYTVNAALVVGHRAVIGAVYAPGRDHLYIGCLPDRASRLVVPARGDALPDFTAAEPITVAPAEAPLRALVSLSHLDPATIAFLERLGGYRLSRIGSSLKFCLLASGEGDIYPRLGPTREWDTAAGQAVLEAAGGRVRTLEGAPLRYGKADRDYTNPGFIACGDLPPLLAGFDISGR